MKKIRVAIFITLILLIIVSVGIIVRIKDVNADDSNETFYEYEESFYEYEESELGNEMGETSSENFTPTEIK